MNRILPFSRTRIAISIAIGVIAFAIAAIQSWNDESLGDTPARIKEAGDWLEQFRQFSISNTTARLRQAMKIEYLSEGANAYSSYTGVVMVAFNDGRKFQLTVTRRTTADEFASFFQKKFEEKPWEDLKAASSGLTYRWNQNVLKGKALLYLDEKPDSCETYEWDYRFGWAKDGFKICTTSERAWRSFGEGLGALGVFAPVSWLALLVLSWVMDGCKFSNLGVKRLFIVGLICFPLFMSAVSKPLDEHGHFSLGGFLGMGRSGLGWLYRSGDFSFGTFVGMAFVFLLLYLVVVRVARWVWDGFFSNRSNPEQSKKR